MINEIKIIIQNYINNAKLCRLMVGTIAEDGIRVNEKLFIPVELVVGNLKNTVTPGQTVRILRDQGGQLFYILEVISE